MNNKKTKLTISGSPKKSFKNLETSKNLGKKTVIIEKHSGKFLGKGGGNKSFGSKTSSNYKQGSGFKPSFTPKNLSSTSDFEKRKLAE